MNGDDAPGSGGRRWRSGPALHRAVLVVAALLCGALLTGEGSLVVLAAPLMVGTVAALLPGAGAGAVPLRPARWSVNRSRRRAAWRAHRAALRARPWPVSLASAPPVAGQGQRVQVRVDVDHADGGQLAVVQVPAGRSSPIGRHVATAVREGRASVRAAVHVSRWGIVTVARPDMLLAGPDALLLHDSGRALERRVAILPVAERVPAAPLPPRAAGLVGAHRTRRPGEGSELLDVREYRAGDRMRRIDWRVSARRGALHVRRTAVDSDADVVLCLDTRYDLGDDVAGWPHPPGLGDRGATRPGSSLDVAVRATASLAETFLRQGDRVSFLDLARPQLGVPSGTGVRHLRRIRRQLAEVAVHLHARKLLLRQGSVPSSAVIVLISPMVDEAVADLAVALRRRGRDLVVVDVMPPVLHPPRRSRSEQLAHRLLAAERAMRLRTLGQHGVLVTRWDPLAVPVRLRRRARDRRRAA